MPQLYGGPTSPNGATFGDQWANPRTGRLAYFDGGKWVVMATLEDVEALRTLIDGKVKKEDVGAEGRIEVGGPDHEERQAGPQGAGPGRPEEGVEERTGDVSEQQRRQPQRQGGEDRTREHEDAERRGPDRPAPPPPRTDAEREADRRSDQVTPDDTPEQRQDANR